MRHIIIGTAGHIDHGKTTLIKALTGNETDTLEEEQKRGISINLGFTYFDLPSGTRVGIVDVPGHERFIKNMMAGANGIDLVLMIIAADEGVMPQTVEHLDILNYMNVKQGIVVVTKCDMVDEELLELVKEDIQSSLSDTFLKDADLVMVDSISGRGIDQLIEKIEEVSEKMEEDDRVNNPERMNIDRVFSLKGHGTIVTGTLLEGTITTNSQLVVYPEEIECKIRSIQVHGEPADKVYAGQRTALNISNLKVDQLERGDVIARKNTLQKSRMIDVRINMTKHSDFELKHWTRIRLFHGTREILGRAVPLEKEIMAKGDSGLVQLRLEDEIYCKTGDKFVLRSYSPVHTIGGGEIIETVSTRHTIHDSQAVEQILLKERGNLKDIIYGFINSDVNTEATLKNIEKYVGEDLELIKEKIEELIAEKKIFLLDDIYISDMTKKDLEEHTLSYLDQFHKKNPLKFGISKENLRDKTTRIDRKNYNEFLKLLNTKIKIQENTVALSDFEMSLSDEEEKIKKVLYESIQKAQPNFVKISDLIHNNAEKRVLSYLLETQLSKIEDFVITKEYETELTRKLIEFLSENEKITVAEYRDVTNLSRKMAVAMLENLDAKKITKRFGNDRRLY